MTSNARCSMRRLAALAIATSLLSGCATIGSEAGGIGTCPHVVEYSRALQAHVAEELGLLPDRSASEEMLSDYAVMRDQARMCDYSGL